MPLPLEQRLRHRSRATIRTSYYELDLCVHFSGALQTIGGLRLNNMPAKLRLISLFGGLTED